MNRTKIYVVTFSCLCLFLTSCNTLSGIGKDLSSIGGVMTNTAERRYMGQQTVVQPIPQNAIQQRR